jgi:hypothetical protein
MAKPVFTICLDKLVLLLNAAIVPLDNLQQSGNKFSVCKLSDTVSVFKNSKQFNPNYYTCFDVMLNNKLFGQLYYNSKGKYRYSVESPMLLHVANHVLYADGLAAKLNLLLENLPDVSFHSYQNIDIAIDGHDLVCKHETFVKSKQYQRKANIKNISIIWDERNKEQVGYTVGSKQSDKHIGIYRKQAEIIFSGKNYISAFWGRNGLLPMEGKSIDRVEGRLTSKELLDFGTNFTLLEDPVHLASYFKLKFENYLAFGKTSNSRERRHLINWQQIKTVTIEKEITTTIAPESSFATKITLHKLFDDFLCSGDENTLKTFLKIVSNSSLIDWTISKSPHWRRGFSF